MRVSVNYNEYSHSRGATILSVMGGVLKGIGLPMILLYGVGIIFIGIGLGMQKLAEVVNRNKVFRMWLKSLSEQGILEKISYDTELAVHLYEANPDKKTLKYLEKANPKAAEIIRTGKVERTKTMKKAEQSTMPEKYNIDREKYENLYIQLGTGLLSQEYANRPQNIVNKEMLDIIDNRALLNQRDNDCLLKVYAFLKTNVVSMNTTNAIIIAEYVYRTLRARDCER